MGACLGAAAWLSGAGCKAPDRTPGEQLADARELVVEVRLALSQAADASGRAVLADTDEASVAFARDAVQSRQRAKERAEALTALLRRLSYADELRAVEEFARHFVAYETVDRAVLELAVENTNLKAQHLSFGLVRERADALCGALDAVSSASTQKRGCDVVSVALRAIVAVREVEVLHAPHIAEPNDAAMTRLEAEMDARRRAVRAAVATLAGLVDGGVKARIDDAGAELDRFDQAHGQLIALSRKNTNVRSLAISLGEGRARFGACEESLRSLGEALSKRGTTATR